MGASAYPGNVNQGIPGAGYGGTSATSDVPIGAASGTRTLATQAGLAYGAGSRVRAIDSGNVGNWVEGPVSSYGGTSLVIAVDKVSGSGTPAGWVLSLAGQPGADGEGGGAPGSWTAPTLLNSFADFGGAWQTVAYRMEADGVTVRLRGLMSFPVSLANPIFILPVGFRPTKDEIFTACVAAGGTRETVRIDVLANGEVAAGGTEGDEAFLSLSGITFSTV